MEKSQTQKLAKVLQVLVTVTFLCNLLALPLVPGVVGISFDTEGWAAFEGLAPYENAPWQLPVRVGILFLLACWQYLFRVWREPYAAVLTLFLLACGTCTAVILWQARKVLDTVIAGNPFQAVNAKSLGRAAVCCFVISLAALVRLGHQVAVYGRFTAYNALFVPVFLMAGLLCLVMSALFRQAAQLKEENDLTI